MAGMWLRYLRHCAYDLDSDLLSCSGIDSLYHFSESALTKKLEQIISLAELAVLLDNIVTVFVIDLVSRLVALHGLSVSLSTLLCSDITNLVYGWHVHLFLLASLLLRWDVFSIFRQIASGTFLLLLGLLLLAIQFRAACRALSLLASLCAIQFAATTCCRAQ